MKKVNNTNWFLRILSLLFIFYISMYLSNITGFYENKKSEEVMLTNESIKRFEEDIKNNKNIDVNDYLIKKNNDYHGLGNDIGENVSSFFEKLLTEETGKMAKLLKKMFF